jgi:hypothetical protein
MPIKSRKPGAAFQPAEDALLTAKYKEFGATALAKKLGRTLSSTQSRLRHLGLRKRDSGKPRQERVTILFDEALMPTIRANAQAANMSMSAYVQDRVWFAIQESDKVTRYG